MGFETMSQLGDTLRGILQIREGDVGILDRERVRGPLLDRLAETAARHQSGEMRGTARWLLKVIAPHFGVYFASSKRLREVAPRGWTLPAVSIRAEDYAGLRALFRAAVQTDAGAFFLVPADSGNTRAFNDPALPAPLAAAAAVQEGFAGPLFIGRDDGEAKAALICVSRDNGPGDAEAEITARFRCFGIAGSRAEVQRLVPRDTAVYRLRDEIAAALTGDGGRLRPPLVAALCAPSRKD